VRHSSAILRLEPEYRPHSPHIFDEDASFWLIPNKFGPEYFALESYNYPGHYVQDTGDGRLKVAKHQNTAQFRDSASFTTTRRFLKRMSTKVCPFIYWIIEKKLQFITLLTAIMLCFTHRKQQKW